MPNLDTIPTQEEFLAAPHEVIAAIAPRSMVYAPGGTRRSAAFAGIEPGSERYLRWLSEQMLPCLETIFRYGVNHVFMPFIMLGHVNEANADIAKEVVIPAARLATDPYLLTSFRDRGWRLRLTTCAYHELLQPYMQRLHEGTATDSRHTLWGTMVPSHSLWWSNLLALARMQQIESHDDAIRALYGESIPPITLCLSFGKPMVSPDLFPPLLMGSVQCYWSQQIGYSLTDQQFRKVLYDAVYLRKTWQKDKAMRAKEAQDDQTIWEQEVVLGLGKRLGPFWYPELSQPSAQSG